MSHIEGGHVRIKIHEEDTIISNSSGDSVSSSGVPLITAVAPWSMILLGGPWVAHLDQLDGRAVARELLVAEDGVGVTLDEAIVILVSIVVTRSVHLNKFFTLIARLEFGVEKIL